MDCRRLVADAHGPALHGEKVEACMSAMFAKQVIDFVIVMVREGDGASDRVVYPMPLWWPRSDRGAPLSY